jgi:protein SCO1/2
MLRGVSFAVAAAALALAAGAAAQSPQFAGPTLKHPSTPPDFALPDQDGRLVRLASQRGKVTLITFLYTHCPDFCPLTAQNLNDVLRTLGAARRNVTVIALSVDPKGDTPKAVDAFVRNHRLLPQFHYLTGTSAQMQPIWDAYQVTSVRRGGPDPDHTLYTLVVDRSGKARILFDALARPPAIAHDVRLLLAGATS